MKQIKLFLLASLLASSSITIFANETTEPQSFGQKIKSGLSTTYDKIKGLVFSSPVKAAAASYLGYRSLCLTSSMLGKTLEILCSRWRFTSECKYEYISHFERERREHSLRKRSLIAQSLTTVALATLTYKLGKYAVTKSGLSEKAHMLKEAVKKKIIAILSDSNGTMPTPEPQTEEQTNN